MENQYYFEYHEVTKVTYVDLKVGSKYLLSFNSVPVTKPFTSIVSSNFHHDPVGVDTIPVSTLQMRKLRLSEVS